MRTLFARTKQAIARLSEEGVDGRTPRNTRRMFKSGDMHVESSTGACPQEELDPTMASKKSKTTKKAKKGKR